MGCLRIGVATPWDDCPYGKSNTNTFVHARVYRVFLTSCVGINLGDIPSVDPSTVHTRSENPIRPRLPQVLLKLFPHHMLQRVLARYDRWGVCWVEIIPNTIVLCLAFWLYIWMMPPTVSNQGPWLLFLYGVAFYSIYITYEDLVVRALSHCFSWWLLIKPTRWKFL